MSTAAPPVAARPKLEVRGERPTAFAASRLHCVMRPAAAELPILHASTTTVIDEGGPSEWEVCAVAFLARELGR